MVSLGMRRLRWWEEAIDSVSKVGGQVSDIRRVFERKRKSCVTISRLKNYASAFVRHANEKYHTTLDYNTIYSSPLI